MRAETIGIGFIGSSWMARAHAHALHGINRLAPLAKRIRLVSMAGRNRDRLRRTASDLGFERCQTSWEAVVEDDEVDVVANLAPNPLHAEPSIAALRLGKPVLCEKPLAGTAAEAREMLLAAEASGVLHCCGFNYRFVPAIRLARSVVASGRLGEIRHFRGLYLQDWARPDVPFSWRFERYGNSSGAVGDYSHIVDLLRHLAGEPSSLTASVARFVHERPDAAAPDTTVPVDVEDAYAAVLELDEGGLATLEASRCATGWKGRQRIEIDGSEGSLWWDMEDLNRLHVFVGDDERERLGGFRDVLVTEREHPFLDKWWGPGHILGWEHTFFNQWLSFLSAVLDEGPLPAEQASFEDGYRAAVVCDAIVTAAQEGRRVAIAHAESALA